MKWQLVVANIVWEADDIDIELSAAIEEFDPGILSLCAAVVWESVKDVQYLASVGCWKDLNKSQRERYRVATTGGDPLQFLQEDSLAHRVLGISPELFQ